MYNENGLLAILAILGAFAFILFIIAVVMYILLSLGLYNLAKNAGIENPWLAWIPIGNLYILGKLVRNVQLGSLEIPSLEIILPIASVAVPLLAGIPVIGWILDIAYVVLLIIVLYRLYNMYRPQQATLWIILSILFCFIGMPAILIFVMRNDKPVI